MTISTSPFDAAKYLNDVEAQAVFLEDAIDSGHAGVIARALGTLARAQGMTGVAEEVGMKRTALYRTLGEQGNPTLETLLKVAKALHLKLTLTPETAEDRELEHA